MNDKSIDTPDDYSINLDECVSSAAEDIGSLFSDGVDCFYASMTPCQISREELERRIQSGEPLDSTHRQEKIEFVKENPVLFAAYFNAFMSLYSEEVAFREAQCK